ncbi:MAG TPA: D-2-hydroxyacid dehydrogenase [Flavihumibacter sp.]|nr:D-2-hydroxyacid dehydrogenase [Flavihumibacter sp.]HQD10317.1 D-2-hydroxyacid dehydrogenase [Flavihumibacter sp.]
MKIVVLDGHTLNPGDLDWSPLEALGTVTIYDRTSADEVVKRVSDAAVVFTNKVPLDKETLAQLPALKFIGVHATGYNIIDTAAASAQGIVVCNVPGYSTDSVVQMAFALLLELTHHVQRHSDDVRAGGWSRSPDFSYHLFPLVELAGKTMGIVGFGNIGQQMAKVAAAFGMQVAAFSRMQKQVPGLPPIVWLPKEELFAQADVVSLHCPLTADTTGMVNRSLLQWMKPTAFLLNTSRGPLVNEQDLADALREGKVAGAGIDVLTAEPPAADNPLLTAPNCLVTPHIAWASSAARQRLMQTSTENLKAWMSGKPINVVNI